MVKSMDMLAPKSLVPTVSMPEPVAFGGSKWKVSVRSVGDAVEVCLQQGFCECDFYYIRPPSWFDRQRGITWEQKIENVKQRLQKTADKMNTQEQAAKQVVVAIENTMVGL